MSLGVKRNSRSGLVACMKDRRSETVRDAFNDLNRSCRIWMLYTDRGGEFLKHMDRGLRENSIWHSTTAGKGPTSEWYGGRLRGHFGKRVQVASASQRSEETDGANDQRHNV